MIRWPLGTYRVAGDSMLPTYRTGDTLLGLRWFRPRSGDIVVVNRGRAIIKRVVKTEGDQIWVEGDNPDHSVDSRHFGPVGRAQIEAKIFAKL